MKRTFLDNLTEQLTSRLTSQRNEVLFFATAHFLLFNLSQPTFGTFAVAPTTQNRPKATAKAPNLPPHGFYFS